PLSERLEVGHRSDRTADQALNLDRAAALLATRRLTVGALAGGGRQQRILRRQPPATLAVEPARHAVLDGGRAEHLRLARRVQHGAVRLLEIVGNQLEWTQLVGAATIGPRGDPTHAAAASSAASSTCSTSSIGSWRKRAPISRNAAGSPVVRNR